MQIHLASKHLVAEVAVALDVSGREHVVVVAKGTWSIPSAGQRPRPLTPQPIVMTDEFYGEPGESPLRCGHDFARFKPRCDVIFDASAHAPDGEPTRRMDVEVKVGTMTKRVRVHGRRRWQRLLGVNAMTDAEPFNTMPLHHGLAFGGTRWYDKGDEKLCEAWLSNPAGVGYAGRKTVGQIHGELAPSLEDPRKSVSSPSGDYAPVALSPLAPHWSPRRELAGTYDDAWRENVFPLLPEDFDEAHHQVAPLDQRIDYPTGGEAVMLKGILAAQSQLSFSLPRLTLHGELMRTDDSIVPLDLHADTLFFETEQGRFSVTWRASVPLRRRIQEVKAIGMSPFTKSPLSAANLRGSCVGCSPAEAPLRSAA